mmetsp:Transcript_11906/g.15665  ORF Transcript_11906/g.15665 Transcript_11906/m.15665 type:complete len:108 (-) Transcript_11906:62-385(-)|eukprot:CAMPEP_0185777078 /NCGR_PEP_ID=MMETSP1174-20130828/88219_1 /TAXON_ID=35687 /ORGANISM="Dictyocha speculum, Strain CCMP1381" /LENGTH=107 /DNA_ID=CAMNT_0028465331 /DNA_START=880 /DNA_END=1203 /DNA_ORIENTATION=+
MESLDILQEMDSCRERVTSESDKTRKKHQLKARIESSRAMLFMKGNPEHKQQCGLSMIKAKDPILFCAKSPDFLTTANEPFGSFDIILANDAVRSNLHSYYDLLSFP